MRQLYRRAALVVALFTSSHYLAHSQAASSGVPATGQPFLIDLQVSNQPGGRASNPLAQLDLENRAKWAPLGQKTGPNGFVTERYQQYHQGIKVEYGQLAVHSKNGQRQTASGEYYAVPAQLKLKPSLSQEQALQRATAFVGAKTYQWQTAPEKQKKAPQGELVLYRVAQRGKIPVENGAVTLAYKFDIYAVEPLSRQYIYVDAIDGTVVGTDQRIKHVDGHAHTRYSGQRPIKTIQIEDTYRLRDLSRGQGIETYNMQGGTDYTKAVDFEDKDNRWTGAEHANAQKDDAALDAHWGAEKVYDYFLQKHGRNSYDNQGSKIKSYVHFDQEFINAFWNGEVMTYGDGDTLGNGLIVQPLTSLDIVAHEIAHGVTEYSANLVYAFESGALNESLSDIWAAAIEYAVDPAKSTWELGEDIGLTFRSMSNPNVFGDPDTYLGRFWVRNFLDRGGVHINSGVMNHWFYLLTVGGSGVNDNGHRYSVSGIGMEKAAKLVYQMQTQYLTPNSEYSQARLYAIQSAIDLYGAGSVESIQTAKAWDAVGVYDPTLAPTNLTATVVAGDSIQLTWAENVTGEVGFQIQRSTQPEVGFAVIDTVGPNVTTYLDNDSLGTDTVYFYRVRTILDSTFSTYSNVVRVELGEAPFIMQNGTYTTCNETFLDPGGEGNYANYEYKILTLTPATPGTSIQVRFSEFDVEEGYDELYVFDGSNIDAPLLGVFTGSELPPTLTASNPEGQLTFGFVTDSEVTAAGWRATINCVRTAVDSLTLVSATTHQDIRTLKDGDVINLKEVGHSLSVRANTPAPPNAIGSVVFKLDGEGIRIENLAPYTLAGDAYPDLRYYPWTFTLGQHTLMAIPYTLPNGQGVAGKADSVTFTVVDADVVSSLVLVNAETGQDITTLKDGDVINLAQVGRKLNIRANTSPKEVGSVLFELDGRQARTENLAPYALAGDDYPNAGYYAWTPSLGQHTLMATPYTMTDGQGVAGIPRQVSFTVTDSTGGEVALAQPLAYPNPGSGKYTLGVEAKDPEKATIYVYDFRGNEVYRKETELQVGHTNVDIDLSALPDGNYYLKTVSEKQSFKAIQMVKRR